MSRRKKSSPFTGPSFLDFSDYFTLFFETGSRNLVFLGKGVAKLDIPYFNLIIKVRRGSLPLSPYVKVQDERWQWALYLLEKELL